MLNDRELIEHWHMRELLTWLYLSIAACGMLGIIFLLCAIGWADSRLLFSTMAGADVVMMLRIQFERQNDKQLPSTGEYFRFYGLHKDSVALMKKDAIIMHPLPKINEIEKEVDADPRAAYFRQAQNGLYVRMALLLYAFEL